MIIKFLKQLNKWESENKELTAINRIYGIFGFLLKTKKCKTRDSEINRERGRNR